MLYDIVLYDSVLYDSVPHDSVLYDSVPHDIVPHDIVTSVRARASLANSASARPTLSPSAFPTCRPTDP